MRGDADIHEFQNGSTFPGDPPDSVAQPAYHAHGKKWITSPIIVVGNGHKAVGFGENLAAVLARRDDLDAKENASAIVEGCEAPIGWDDKHTHSAVVESHPIRLVVCFEENA